VGAGMAKPQTAAMAETGLHACSRAHNTTKQPAAAVTCLDDAEQQVGAEEGCRTTKANISSSTLACLYDAEQQVGAEERHRELGGGAHAQRGHNVLPHLRE